jgi:hypothetical protein
LQIYLQIIINHFLCFQERSGSTNNFDHGSLSLKYKLDNEFDLIFVVAFQKILQLSYVDKFLNDVHLEFRDMYKNVLQEGDIFGQFDFISTYRQVLSDAEDWAKLQLKVPRQMRSFEESQKSKKTVSSMIERKGEQNQKKPGIFCFKLLYFLWFNWEIFIFNDTLYNFIIFITSGSWFYVSHVSNDWCLWQYNCRKRGQ